MANIELVNTLLAKSMPPALQPVSMVERYVGKAHVTLIGVEHEAAPQSYPWHAIRQSIEHLGGRGAIALEYFPSELEQTIYQHRLLGRYARRYAARAGITHFFGGVSHIAAHTGHTIIVLDPANTALFQLLYLHLPLAACAVGTAWWWYAALETLQRHTHWGRGAERRHAGASSNPRIPRAQRSTLLHRVLASMLLSAGLGGVAWFAQDTRYRYVLQPIYREYGLHMRDMRWVTIAQGLAQYGRQHRHRVVVLYPPAHLLDGIVHYLDHPEQRKHKYRFYAKVLPGITKAIRTYRWHRDHWRLVHYEPIVADDA